MLQSFLSINTILNEFKRYFRGEEVGTQDPHSLFKVHFYRYLAVGNPGVLPANEGRQNAKVKRNGTMPMRR
jgi:hypothetical protein